MYGVERRKVQADKEIDKKKTEYIKHIFVFYPFSWSKFWITNSRIHENALFLYV